MTKLKYVVRGCVRGGRWTCLPIVVAAPLLAIGSAVAQTVPHQAPERLNIGSGVGQADLPEGGVFQPRVEIAVQYVDNIQLAEDDQPQVDVWGIELAPGFYASYSSEALVTAIDYSLIGRVWDEDDFSDVSHRLAANGQWFALPEWFSIRGQASYQDTVIEPGLSTNYGYLGIFGPSNLVEVGSAGVNPILQHRFNDFELTAQYSYGRTWYFDEGTDQPVLGRVGNEDSVDQQAGISFGTADTGAKLAGRVFYDWQRSDYDLSLPYEYERAGLDASLQVARSLWIVGDVGQESDLEESTTQGGLDSNFWSAGARWQPDNRNLAEARYGERFFGRTYFLLLEHRARKMEFSASYQEDPSVETRKLSVGEFNPGQLPPGSPGVDFGRLNATPFVAKSIRAGVTAQGLRTTVRITGLQIDREYLSEIQGQETQTIGALGVTRQLASNLSADFDLTYTELGQSFGTVADPRLPVDENFYDTEMTLRLNRSSGERLTLSGETGYFQRAGDRQYDGWWVALRVRYTP